MTADGGTLHVVALPHTETTRAYAWCAYTQKVRHFCDMMTGVGRRVVLYGGTRNEAEVAEHVELITDADREKWFGSIDFTRDAWDGFDADAEWWRQMNGRAALAIAERSQRDSNDYLCVIAGVCQQQIGKHLPGMTVVEWGIGYEGVFADYRVYESEAWRHWLWGRDGIADGRFYDAVIPNAFDPNEFTPCTQSEKGDYLLFLGRHIDRKGTEIVRELAKRHRVITAGQAHEPIEGTEHVGMLDIAERAKYLARAKALIAPTLYIEPFGGVAVEAMLSGTPVISTPWGAFSETVVPGVTGFRCSTLKQFRIAAWLAPKLKSSAIVQHAIDRYSMRAVAPLYASYFDQLDTLHGDGWYAR